MAEVTEATVRTLVKQLVDEHGKDELVDFLGAQFDLGLWRMDFPTGCGGLDASPQLQEVVDTELEKIGRRYTLMRNPMGIGMCGPTIVARGTDEQRARFLRPIFTAEEIWCQLFSEPGAGSDVAGLATRAERDGDEWIVNGQKIWTSAAHQSRWGLLIARTDPEAPKHKGITAFIVDMHDPSIEIRGIRSMAGGSHFNEVFFTDTRVPDAMRVGDVGEGWRVANATLMNERVSLGSDVTPRGSGPIAGAVEAWGNCPDKTPAKQDRLMRLWIRAELLRLGSLRAQAKREKGVPGPEGSVLKMASGELSQQIASFTVELLGPAGMLCPPFPDGPTEAGDDRRAGSAVMGFVSSPASTIAGGTNDIQRNIIGERVLGLPREPSIDLNTPWSQIPRS